MKNERMLKMKRMRKFAMLCAGWLTLSGVSPINVSAIVFEDNNSFYSTQFRKAVIETNLYTYSDPVTHVNFSAHPTDDTKTELCIHYVTESNLTPKPLEELVFPSEIQGIPVTEIDHSMNPASSCLLFRLFSQ